MGSATRGDRGDRAGVHAAAQVGAESHVADQLAVDGLPEQAVELFAILCVRVAGCVGLAEVDSPSSASRTSAALAASQRRAQRSGPRAAAGRPSSSVRSVKKF